MKLIVGLGNPGSEYRNSRHNLGFRVLDRLAEALGVWFNREKYKGLIAECQHAGQRVLLLKPQTYMNLSGESVALAARNRVNNPEDLLVIYDEADLPLGRLRIRRSGSPGTHNGMKSVIASLGTQEVPRIRLGVGVDSGRALKDHVLGSFRPEERETVEAMIGRALEAALACIESGPDAAMNSFNRIGEDG